MSLGKKTVQGMLWNYLSFGGGKLLTFISTIILARLLAPAAFGQVAIALLVIAYLDAVGDLGVAAALIYQREDVERASHVAFVISVGMGLVLSLISALSAPLIASYFKEPNVAPMLQVLSINFIIQALGNVHDALLRKELLFRRRLLPDLTRTLAKGGASIAFALLGFGAWSLVYGQVIGTTVATVALWVAHPWMPRLTWDRELGRKLLGYGLQIVMVELLAVVWTTADYIIVGRLLGAADLGLYQQAFRVTDLLIINLCFIAGRVLFPSFAKMNHSREALSEGFLATARYVALLALPISFGLCAISPLFVPLVFGNKWLAMIPALQILSLRAGLSALSFNSGHVLKAMGRPGLVNLQMLVKLAILIPAVLFTVQFGFVAVAAGQVFVALCSVLIDFGTITRVLGVAPGAIWRQIRPALLAALVMGAGVWAVVRSAPEWARLGSTIVAVLAGLLIYGAMLWWTERALVTESIRSLRQMVRPAPQAATRNAP